MSASGAGVPLVFVVDWDETSAARRQGALEALGFRVEIETSDGGRAYRRVREGGPVAVVLDVARRSSHGIQTAEALRRSAATRSLPLLFVGADEEVARRVAERLPGATVSSDEELPEVLRPWRARPEER